MKGHTDRKSPRLQKVNETWQLVALVELCSMSISSPRSHGFGLRPLMFARRLTFLRLWACHSRCLPALGAGSPLMHEKGTLRLCLHRTLTWPFRNVRFAVRHSPPLSLANTLLLSRCPCSASCHADEGQHQHFRPEKKDGYSTITQRTEKPWVLSVLCSHIVVVVDPWHPTKDESSPKVPSCG